MFSCLQVLITVLLPGMQAHSQSCGEQSWMPRVLQQVWHTAIGVEQVVERCGVLMELQVLHNNSWDSRRSNRLGRLVASVQHDVLMTWFIHGTLTGHGKWSRMRW